MGKHRLDIGDTFRTITKRQHKGGSTFHTPRLRVLHVGDKEFFEKGKRKYLCEVIGLLETKVGRYNLTTSIRYWQFTYLVKVIED